MVDGRSSDGRRKKLRLTRKIFNRVLCPGTLLQDGARNP